MTLEKMMDKVIAKFGFEARETLTFCYLCEDCEKGVLNHWDVVQEYNELMR